MGKSTQRLDSSPDWGSYSKVILNTKEGEGFTAGDDTGLTLEADCPYATQAIANAVLARLNGFTYKPYTATKAAITPAAEIGDGMTADGFYSGIYATSQDFSRLNAVDIAAPCNTEVAHEIQYTTTQERKFVRQAKEVNATLSILSNEISAKVEAVNNNQAFGWSLTESAMVWTNNSVEVMRVDANGLKINGTIQSGSILTGDLYIGGTDINHLISSQNLYTGSYQSAINHSSWSTGATYAGRYNNATNEQGTYQCPYFRLTKLYCTSTAYLPLSNTYLGNNQLHCSTVNGHAVVTWG